MTTTSYIVTINNEDIIMQVSETSFGTVSIMGGVPGPPGQSSGINFTQSTPSSTWTINHNLGYRPSIDLFTVGGVIMLGEVVHISLNQIVVNFTEPVAGFARLN